MQEYNPGADRLGTEGDAVYEMLMQAHEGLSENQSHNLNIRLVLLMANRIGVPSEIEKIIETAKQN